MTHDIKHEQLSSRRRLAGRRILITGASSGIGRQTAELFATEGAEVALLDHARDGLIETATQTGGAICSADVTDEESVFAAVAHAAEAMHGIDGIVNAAGVVIAPRINTGQKWNFLVP